MLFVAGRTMGITIKEVARQAGVSIATVSRVLNDSGPVTEITRRKVKAAAAALNYKPNSVARSLITSKTFTIGVLLPDLFGEFFSEVIRGIDQTARRSRYHLLVSSSHDDEAELEAALRAMSGRVDGLLVMSPDLRASVLEANLPAGLPVVLLNCLAEGSPFDSINIDNFTGAYDMVRHLQAHGHKRIAIIRGAAGNHDADERLRGYRTAMKEAGIETLIECDGDFTESSGYWAVRRILEMSSRATAIFASNDSMAIGVLRAVQEAGLRVPRDMAVAGFDNIPVAGFLSPTLSSVHVSISEMGARAVQLLVQAIEGHEGPSRRIVLPTELVIRESSGGHPAVQNGA